jgi:glutamate-1-semialdehyde 2,1-aminomutase
VGPESARHWRRALELVAGGSSSPARDYGQMGLDASLVAARGRGAYLYDLDGRPYLDYLQSYGAGILGHGRPEVARAAARAVEAGPVWGLPCRDELALAELLSAAIPCLERMRFVSTGTEALMSLARLARAVTGRDLIVKFDAGYHGHADPFLGDTGSAAAHAAADREAGEAAGVPEAVRRLTVTLPWGDAAAFDAFMAARGREVAAVFFEPVAANIGLCEAPAGFLQRVAEGTGAAGALLVADEVITAFRFRAGSMCDALHLRPDLMALGKVVGGGLPIGVYGGRAELMAELSPGGRVFQAGTHAGNPVSMATGLATLRLLNHPGVYPRLAEMGAELERQLRQAAAAAGWPVILHRLGGAVSLWCGTGDVAGPADVERTDVRRFAALFAGLLRAGVLTPPSPYEVWFVSLAHAPADLRDTGERAYLAMRLADALPT